MSYKMQVKTLPTLVDIESSMTAPPRWLYEAKALFVEKITEDERVEALSYLETRLNQIGNLSSENCIGLADLANYNKNSGFNALATRIFLRTSQCVEDIEAKRLQILNCLKTKQIISLESFKQIYSVYKIAFLGKLELQYSQDQTDTWRKHCKSIMTSLKKMMVLKKKQKKSNKHKNDSHRYTINIDVKHLIRCCEVKSRDEKCLNKKILDMIFKTKNGWAGPRLWKIVYDQRWTTSEIDQFVQFFTSSFETFKDHRSEYKKLRIAVDRIVKNLKALNSKTQKETSQTQADWDEMLFELPVYEKGNIEIELREYEVFGQDIESGVRTVDVDDGTLEELSWL
jgi:hypothetical protein